MGRRSGFASSENRSTTTTVSLVDCTHWHSFRRSHPFGPMTCVLHSAFGAEFRPPETAGRRASLPTMGYTRRFDLARIRTFRRLFGMPCVERLKAPFLLESGCFSLPERQARQLPSPSIQYRYEEMMYCSPLNRVRRRIGCGVSAVRKRRILIQPPPDGCRLKRAKQKRGSTLPLRCVPRTLPSA